MKRSRHIVAVQADMFAANALVELDGVSWRVLRIVVCESPFLEADVMSVSAPQVYFVELEPASV